MENETESYEAETSETSEASEASGVETEASDEQYAEIPNYEEGEAAAQEYEERQREDSEEFSEDEINEVMMDYLRENYDMPDKFKDVGSILNSYKHLESRMGALKGAPDTYELDDSIVDGLDETILEGIVPIAHEMGVSNDGLNHLLSAAVQSQAKSQEANWAIEKQKLGSDADTQINNALSRLNANFTPEVSESIQGMIQTADDFRALNTLLDKALSHSVPAQMTASDDMVGGEDPSKLLYAKDEHGNLKMEHDPEYAKRVMRMLG